MDTIDYCLEEKPPSVEEYIHLRQSVNWPFPNENVIEKSLNNSIYCVCAVKNDHISMSRLVGDHSFIYFIADVIVLSEYQDQGIGTALMKKIISYLQENVQDYSYITPISAKRKEAFYEKSGFFKRPTDKFGYGMMVEL